MVFALACVSLAVPAHAAPPEVQPVQVGYETVRYQQGVPTLDLPQRWGSVQVRPLPMDHGSLAFAVAVYNGGRDPEVIDIGNFHAESAGQSLEVFSVDQLKGKAKRRAVWSKVGLALLGGVAAAAAASQRDTYRSTWHTPYGTYRGYYSAPSTAGQIQATAIGVGTGVGLARIQENLDRTRAALGNEVVQATTVDPGHSYAGKIVLGKIKEADLPQRVDLTVSWNGEVYPFAFQLAKAGTPAPVFETVAEPSAPASFQPAVLTEAVSGQDGGTPVPAFTSAAMVRPVPRGVDMEALVQRTADLMPRPTVLDDGSKVTGFTADGTRLQVTVVNNPEFDAIKPDWQARGRHGICSARAFQAVLMQGGTMTATFFTEKNQELGALELTGASCRLAGA